MRRKSNFYELRFINKHLLHKVVYFLTFFVFFLLIGSHVQAQNRRYWVGKGSSVNWNNASSWSASSGGASGASVPTATTTVIFDDNSFTADGQAVTLNATGLVCDSMIWDCPAWKPTFNMGSGAFTFAISGSLIFQPNMTITSTATGACTFNSTRTDETIKTCNNVIPRAITLNSATCSWVVEDSLKIQTQNGATTYDITLANGSLDLNGNYVRCAKFTLTNGNLNLDGYTNCSGDFTFTNGNLNLENYFKCAGFISNTANARTLNIANTLIDVTNWTHTAGSVALTGVETANSRIRVAANGTTATNFTGKSGDTYNVVEAGTGTLQGGIFSKIIMNKYASATVIATLNSATVANNVVTDSLILDYMGNPATSSTPYRIYRGTTVTVNQYLGNTRNTGANTEKIEIRSDNPAGVATIVMGAGSVVDLKNVDLYYSNLTGPGAPYYIENSANLGSSSGVHNRLYWVGAAGNWGVAANWSTTSSGPGNSSAPPTSFSTVIFDNSSFTANGQTVTLNTTGICDSMLWTGTNYNPVFALAGNALTLYGSLGLQRGMTVSSTATTTTVTFSSTRPEGETILTNYVDIRRGLTFNSASGSWTLLDSLRLAGTLTFTTGNYNFSKQNVSGAAIILTNGNLNMDSASVTCSTFTFTNGSLSLDSAYLKCTTTANSFLSNATNARTLNMPRALIEVPNWTHTGSTSPLTNSAKSLIRITAAFTGNPGDTYNVVEAGTGVLQGGNFSKIIMSKNNSTLNSATVANDITVDTLILGASATYNIQSGSTVTINDYFYNLRPVGDCSDKVVLKSTSTTVANVAMGPGAVVDLNNVDFSYISITGDAMPYNVDNSLDIGGGSSGWSSAGKARLYWIGGSGNWSDVNHWSMASGGTADACRIPTSGLSAVFDENSGLADGQIVTLNAAGVCDSMLWTGTDKPVFEMGTNALAIYGSLVLQSGMIINSGSAVITFSSTRPQESITTNNITIPRSLTFNSAACEWILQDPLTLSTPGVLTFTTGILNFNGQPVTCITFTGTAANARQLNIANSIINVTNWTYTGNTVPPITTNSVIRVGTAFTGKPGDLYNTVEAGTGTLQGGSFKKIIMEKNSGTLNSATVANNVITDTLRLAWDRTFRIYQGSTVTINKYLANTSVGGTCPKRIQLRSTATNLATIAMGPGAVLDLSNIDFYYVGVAGSEPPYIVAGGNDLEGSTGWTMSSSISYENNRMYWVGGAGNWNDLAHWSDESGGTPSYCMLPTSSMTVVFDNHSGLVNGSVVTLNVDAYCDSMLWIDSHKPVFATGARTLTISGSLFLQPEMKVTSSSGSIIFNSAHPEETIKSSDVNIPCEMYFYSPTCEWILEDSLRLTNGILDYDITLVSGKLNLNENYLKCATFTSKIINTDPRLLNIAHSTLDVSNWTYVGTAALTHSETEKSLIRVVNNFTGVPGDIYNVVEAGSGTIQGGIFSKIIMNKNKGILNSAIAANDVVTDSLILYMGNTYYMYNGRLVTINRYFTNVRTIGGACTEKIALRSLSNAAANIKMESGSTVDLDNVDLYYIAITGPGIPYTINNSVNLGGNSGWVQSASSNYAPMYWVGGSGNWNDLSHWSTVSGGTANLCDIPTSTQTVIFDENSGLTDGKTVTLNVATGVCDSMIWRGYNRPTFAMGTNALTISGSLVLQPNMTISSGASGAITFNSTRAQETVKTNNVNIPRAITFNSATCEWILQDSLKLTNGTTHYALTFTNGNLNLSGKYLKCSSFTSNGTANTRTLNIANATIDLSADWIHSTSTGTLTATNSLIRVGVNFTGRTGNIYGVVEAGTGTIQAGTFSKIIMNKYNGILNSTTAANNIVTDSLIFEKNNTYRMQSGQTVTVRNYLSNTGIVGDCSEKIELRSSSAAVATIAMSAGAIVNLSNLNMYYIRATGAIPYPVPNSIDLGGNSGWTLSTTPYPGPFYWVGGSGNWNDLNHWSKSSGGIANICVVPTSTNTVIFDNLSFNADGQTVTLNVAGVCDSMLWKGTTYKPVFAMAGQALTVSGSLKLQPNMTIISTGGTLTFNSTRAGETITTANVNLPRAITFNSAGGWILQDSLKMTNGTTHYTLTFTNGNLNLNGKYLKCSIFSSSGTTNARTLNIANAIIDISESWTHSTSTGAFTTTHSLIRVGTTFTGRTGNAYNVVEAGTGTLQAGTFSKIIMNKNNGILNSATVANNVITDSLILDYVGNLTTPKSYRIYRGSTVTINKYLGNTRFLEDCSEKIELRSDAASAANIAMTAGSAVDLSNVNFYYINITGATPYSVSNCYNLEGSNGWNIVTGNRMYWIGGSGDWNNVSHWSAQSGGSANVCRLPTNTITVVFDENSGLTDGSVVTLNAAGVCDSMIWRGLDKPVFAMAGQTLTISGSLELQPNMTVTSTGGTLTFNSARAAESITTHNVKIPRAIIFNSSSGEWILQDSLCMSDGYNDYNLTFTNGNLNLNGQYVKCSEFISTASNARELNIAGATVDLSKGWTHTGSSQILTATETVGSLIRTSTNFTGKTADLYNVVEAGSGTVKDGNFSKLIVNKSTTTLNADTIGVINTDTLLFTSGSSYFSIFAGSTVNVEKYLGKDFRTWLAVGSTDGTSGGVPGIINMGGTLLSDSEVKMDTLIITNMTITGPGTDYPTVGSVNRGGNTGWLFNAPPFEGDPTDYYWAGGQLDGSINNLDNWELGFPGSGTIPTIIFNSSCNVYFPPDPKNPPTMNLTIYSTVSFKNLYFNAGSNVTINASAFPVTGTENIFVESGNLTINTAGIIQVFENIEVNGKLTLSNARANNINISPTSTMSITGGTVNATGDIHIGDYGKLTLEASSPATVGHDLNIDKYAIMNVTSSNVTVGHDLNIDESAIMTVISGNISVGHDLNIEKWSVLDITNNSVTIGNDLNNSGKFVYTTASTNAYTISVARDLFVINGGLLDIRRTSGNYNLTVTIQRNTFVDAQSKIYMSSHSTTYFTVTSVGSFTIEGTALFQNTRGFFQSNLTATGGASFRNCYTWLRSANPYIFNLGPQIEDYFSNGYLFFDARAPYTLTYDLIIPTTSLFFTTNNGSFTSNGYRIKTNRFDINAGATAVASRLLDFSNSLIEARSIVINGGTRTTEYNFLTTTFSFWNTANHAFYVNLPSSAVIHKVTYNGDVANRLTISLPGNGNPGLTDNTPTYSTTLNFVIDTLITGDKSIYLWYGGQNFTANNWHIDNYCEIFTTQSPNINVGNLTGPPPAIKCVGISQMHSTTGYINLNRIAPAGSSPQEVHNLYFRSVKFSGNGVPTAFTAPVNYNLGHCSGSIEWTSPPDPEYGTTLYWVGGAGNWHDKNHWSFTSGGEPAICVPTFLDTAIFDDKSFSAANQIVTISEIPAQIHNIIWSDPAREGQFQINNILEIYGSADFSGCNKATCTYDGTTYLNKVLFVGSGNETITSGGLVYNVDRVEFYHTGTYTLLDNFLFSQTTTTTNYYNGIYHYAGNLVSNGNAITAAQFYSASLNSLPRSIDFSNSIIKIVDSNGSDPSNYNRWYLNLAGLTSHEFTGSKIITMDINTAGSAGQQVHYYDLQVDYQLLQSAGIIATYHDIYARARGSYTTATTNTGTFQYGFTAHNILLERYKTFTFNYTTTLPNEYIFTGTFTTNATVAEGCQYNVPVTVIQGNSVTPSRISVLNPPFNLLRASIYRIDCSGGQTMKVTSGIDRGQNINVDIDEMEARPSHLEFYWVGDAGNWNDWTHWSISVSGGNPVVTNPCNYIPTRYDNVFFDVNSFTTASRTVTVNISGAACLNMTWTPEAGSRTPTLSAANTNCNLSVYGSLELAAGITNFNPNVLYMRGTSQVQGVQTIRYNGTNATQPTTLYFTGGGRYDILDSCKQYIATTNSGTTTTLKVYVENGSSLYLQRGLRIPNMQISANSSFYTNGKTVTFHQYLNVVAGTAARTIDLSGSTIKADYFSWALDNFTTVDISNATINLLSTSGTNTSASTFTFNDAADCLWNTANSKITSVRNILLNNNTSQSFPFYNILMTGVTEGTATLGTGSTTGRFSFNKVEFTGPLTLINNASSVYTFDTLKYAVSSTNRIAGGKTLNINEYLFALGTPCGQIYLKSTNSTLATINSVNCNPVEIKFGIVVNVGADISGTCTSEDYVINGFEEEQVNTPGWTIIDFDDRIANLLGEDTLLTCTTPLPYLQTSEGLGVAEEYHWFYRPTRSGPWTPLAEESSVLPISDVGEYSLFVIYASGCKLGERNNIKRFIDIDQEASTAHITTNSTTNLLTCADPEIVLTANEGVTLADFDYSYVWKDRLNDEVGVDRSIAVTDSSRYIVYVTRIRNSCVATDTVRITADQIPPIASITSLSGGTTLSCSNPEVVVKAINNETYVAGTETYFWSGGLGTGNTKTITLPGIYSVIETYPVNGCSDTAHIEITVVDDMISIRSAYVESNPKCAPFSAGTIQFFVTGGSGSYEYTVNNVLPFVHYTTGLIGGLEAGSYRIQVRDAANICYIAESDEIILRNSDSDLHLSVASSNASNCNDIADGALYLTLTGGIAPYSYTYYKLPDPPHGIPAPVEGGKIDHLPTGVYLVEVTDDNGCTATSGEVYIKADDSDLTVTLKNIVHTECEVDTGSVYVEIYGSYPYSYQLDGTPIVGPFSGSYTIKLSNLSAGTHSLRVFGDCNGEIVKKFSINNGISELFATAISENFKVYCHEETIDAYIALSVTNGLPQYRYRYNGGAWTLFTDALSTVDTIRNLQEGSYFIEVSDLGEACIYELDVVKIGRDIVPPVAISSIFAAKEPECPATSGAIQFYVAGGSGEYEYIVNNDMGTVYDYATTGGLIEFLSAGSYKVQVWDKNHPGCAMVQSGEILLRNGNKGLSVSVVASDATNCIDEDGLLSISVSGGIEPYICMVDGTIVPLVDGQGQINKSAGVYKVTVSDATLCEATGNEVRINAQDSDLEVNIIDIVNTACNATTGVVRFTVDGSKTFHYQLDNFAVVESLNLPDTIVLLSLHAGDHTLHVFTDCGEVTETFTITNGAGGLSFTATVTNEAESCDGYVTPGKIDLTVINGTSPYQYSIDGTTWITFLGDTTIHNLSEGLYAIVVKDYPGCRYEKNRVELTREIAKPIKISSVFVAKAPTCKATGAIQIYATGGSGDYEYSINNGLTFVAYPDGLITGLTSGSYRIIVRDTNSRACPTAVSNEIMLRNDSTDLALSVAVFANATDCNPLIGDGILTVTANGGTPPYHFTLNGDPVPIIGNQIPDLPVGVYIVGVEDDNGCITTSEEVRITSDAATLTLSPITIVQDAICGSNIGAVSFTVTGSTSYKYQLNSSAIVGPLTNSDPVSLTGLAAGEHTLRVFDSCNEETVTFTISNGTTGFEATAEVVNEFISCEGNITPGEITLRVTNGMAPYKYRYNGSAWTSFTGNTAVIGHLTEGVYQIELIDYAGCTYEINAVKVTREKLKPLAIGSTFVALQPACGTHGSIQIHATGGSGDYEYSVNGAIFKTYAGGLINNLPAGSYRIEVRDANNKTCPTATSSELMLYNNSSDLTLSVEPTSASTCNPITGNGILTINATGGMPPYTFTLNGEDVAVVGHQIKNLPVGVYVVGVIDDYDCKTTSKEVRITSTASTLAVTNPVVIADSKCGLNSGIVTFTVTGNSNAKYYYQLNNMTMVEVAHNNPIELTDLPAGDHLLQVFDSCGIITKTFTIENTDSDLAFTAMVTHAPVSCENKVSYGKITLTAAHGTPPYQYRYDGGIWKNFTGNTAVINNLREGNYYIEVKDNNDCTYEKNLVNLSREPGKPVAITTIYVASEPDCNHAGSIKVFATGGSGVYEYSVNGLPFQTYANDSITGLSAGSYQIEVRDVNNRSCATAMSHEIMLYNKDLSVTAIVWAHALDCSTADGILLVSANGGVAPYHFTLNGDPVTLTDGKITDLPVGVYIVGVEDDNHCTATSSKLHITSDDSHLEISTAGFIVTNTTCGASNGSVTFTVTGSSAYTYQLNSTEIVAMTTNTPIEITGLSAGTHILYVSDTCGAVTKPFTVYNTDNNLSFTTTAQNVKVHCNGTVTQGHIILTVSGGTPLYSYRYNGGAWLDFKTPSATIDTIPNLPVGNYDIEVKDVTGCVFAVNEIKIIREADAPVHIGSLYIEEEPSCAPSSTGSVRFYVTGGSGAYEYSVITLSQSTPVIPFTTYTDGLITGLPAGTYRIQVKDKTYPDCAIDESGDVILRNSDHNMTLAVIPVNASTCSLADGSLFVLVSGGTSPYHFKLNGIAEDPVAGFYENKPAGTYLVEVTDHNGCIASKGEVIIHSDVSTLDLTPDLIMNTECASNAGIASFIVTGSSAYRYQLNSGAINGPITDNNPIVLTDLHAGTHTLHVFDDCGDITRTFTILNNPGDLTSLSFTTTVQNVKESINGVVTYGQIAIAISGGTPTYSYRINGGSWIEISDADTTLKNLTEGVYYIEVMDATNCTFEANSVKIIREIEAHFNLLNCDAMIDRIVDEDYYHAYHYTHSGTAWDAVLIYPKQPLDSIRYIINDTIIISGLTATLNGIQFPTGISHVIVIDYMGDITDTCAFTVTVERVCPPDVSDIEGHVYPVVKLSGLCWTSNLRATVYADNSPIEWAKPYYHELYPNTIYNANTFGLLYTWYSAVNVPEGSTMIPSPDADGNIQGICPEDWHIPSQTEWDLLTVYPAEDLKSDSLWISGAGTNLTGFNALPAGMCSGAINRFIDLYGFTGFWASNADPNQYAHYYYLSYYCDIINETITKKSDGFSVRCVIKLE